MRQTLRRLFERYRLHHENQPLLQWIGVVGALAFPALYLLRLTSIVPPRYDDIAWRAVGTVLCVGLALRAWWPARWRPWYIAYSYLVVLYCLSFLLTFTALKNQGGALSVVNMVMGTVLIILLSDWRNAILILASGYSLAALTYLHSEPDAQIPSAFTIAAITSIVVVVAGALSHYGQKRAELERLRKVYAGLAGAIAHEVRTPLAQVQHALREIEHDVLPASSAAKAVEQGHAAIRRGLQSIAITLQQISDRRPQSQEFVPLSAEQSVHHALASYAYESVAARECVRLHAEGDFQFRGDKTAFELVLFNLLRNALYYLPLHPAMVIDVVVQAVPSPRVIVRDTGPGIDPRLMPTLFGEFQTMGKAEGTGLGLSFCRRVMRALGGDIRCRSVRGQFTEFELLFPRFKPDASTPAGATPGSTPLAGRRILVVDDQPLNRTIARALLEDMGLQVTEADHGQHALDLLRSGPMPDAVLMDVNMPGVDGIEATRRLRALPGEAGRLPVLALTANDSAAVQAAAREAGMQGVLAKPIDAVALQAALSAAFEGRLAEPPSPAAQARADGDGLLNLARLDNFERLGMLHELLPTALRDLRGHVQALQAAAETGQADALAERLHALVGLAGEVGAQALHRQARERYAAWLDGKRPSGLAWVRDLKAQLEATEQALWRHAGVKAADPPAD